MEKRVVELERELKETNERLAATREQLRLQSRRARQLVAACTSKVEEKEREMRMLRALKDGQLQSIVRKLLHFESLLRQEQRRVVDLVQQKDRIIRNQQLELDELRRQTSLIGSDADSSEFVSSSGSSSLSSSPASDHSTASKLAKLDHHEDKENANVNASDSVPETPLVTKMVRRFELAPPAPITKKPEVPKKPTRLLPTTNTVTSSTATIINNINNMDMGHQQQQQQQPNQQPISKGVVRTDSVNDHGYFTLEKRKPVKMSVVSPEPNEQQQQRHSPCSPRDQRTVDHVTDETDLRNNFEEFHLMDSLEEEEQQQLLQQQQQQSNESTAITTMNESPSITPLPPPRTPDRSSGDGAEWIMHTPPHAPSSADCTALSVSAGSVHLLPQIGDATPTSSSGVQFDRFLDVSGLTQKSILTPSRLLSNHKNMLKPKDVKHRHMVNKASHHHLLLQHQQQQMQQQSSSMANCRSSSQSLLLDPAHLHHRNHSTSQVRYYVEPFL